MVGICNSWSELVTCNLHLRGLGEAVRRGVTAAGGVPLEFPTISLGENLMKPTAMLFRNLMSMDVEECIRAYPLDAVVLIGGCDKTVPAQLMGALSADVPAIALTAGPAEPAMFRGRELGAGTDLWHYVEEVRAGRMTQAEFDELEAAAVARRRPLQRARDGVDAGRTRRGARHVPAGDGGDPGRRSRARARRPRRRARARSSSRARACGRRRSSPRRRSTTRSRC